MSPVTESCTARWSPGSLALTVTCPHGREWAYPVIPIGDRPLPHFLHGLLWMIPPGADWEDDGICWTAAVIPESEEAAGKLYAPALPSIYTVAPSVPAV